MGVSRTIFAGTVLAALGLLPAGALAAPPKVVVSIKPVHSLVAKVMAGVGEPHLLLKGRSSPHSYSLRPSDARSLSGADLIVWVGRDLEGFLEKPLRTLGRRARKLALIGQPGVRTYKRREGGVWEAHDHGDHAGHGHKDHDHKDKDHKDHDHKGHGHKDAGHKDHDHGGHAHHSGVDAHIWLDPQNAIAIVRAVARSLSSQDPANAARYQANAARAIVRLQALSARIRQQLRPVRRRPFIVFHDGFQYFERRFGLAAAGSVTIDGDRAPSARRLYQVRSRIVKSRVRCVFMEPQFSPRLARTVIEGTPARLAVLDPLGADLPAGPAAYDRLITKLATDLATCLR